ncbi:DUF6538 domain-containing protein, partial [Acidithiobacillus sp.]|uniref:DUF6538 domain-containing protein n=1 Tax=Acidithiobacillus sp. TaxID=1872118 RepID=UPI003D03DDFA
MARRVAKREVETPMYILKRGSLYHFSRKLPDRFCGQEIPLRSGPRKVGSNGYLRFSLGTGNRQEAQRLGRRVAVEIDEFLAERQAALERILAPYYAQGNEPAGEVVQDVFDKMSPEEQARI